MIWSGTGSGKPKCLSSAGWIQGTPASLNVSGMHLSMPFQASQMGTTRSDKTERDGRLAADRAHALQRAFLGCSGVEHRGMHLILSGVDRSVPPCSRARTLRGKFEGRNTCTCRRGFCHMGQIPTSLFIPSVPHSDRRITCEWQLGVAWAVRMVADLVDAEHHWRCPNGAYVEPRLKDYPRQCLTTETAYVRLDGQRGRSANLVLLRRTVR